MTKIWLCSDWHLQHDKSFIYLPRGFSSAEEMTKEILRRHNEVVAPEDTVYVLGDCAVGGPVTAEVIEFLSKFNGHKYLAFGNHDGPAKLKAYEDAGIFEDIQMGYRIRYKKMEFIFTHYPTIVANGDDPKPIWCIHGHLHLDNAFCEIPHCYNVNMEAHNCYPVEITRIYEEIKNC